MHHGRTICRSRLPAVEPGRSLQQECDALLGGLARVAASAQHLQELPHRLEGRQVRGVVLAVGILGELLAAGRVPLPAEIAAADQQSPLRRRGEEDHLGMRRMWGEDPLGNVRSIERANLPRRTLYRTLGVLGTRLEIAAPVREDDLVAAARVELRPERALEEREVEPVRQDEGVLPGTFQALRHAKVLTHGATSDTARSPSSRRRSPCSESP